MAYSNNAAVEYLRPRDREGPAEFCSLPRCDAELEHRMAIHGRVLCVDARVHERSHAKPLLPIIRVRRLTHHPHVWAHQEGHMNSPAPRLGDVLGNDHEPRDALRVQGHTYTRVVVATRDEARALHAHPAVEMDRCPLCHELTELRLKDLALEMLRVRHVPRLNGSQ
eukprot:1603591-Pyramimonas_sp.AAC.6